MRYKKPAPRKSLPEIARELNVDAILEGTVSHANNKVRITAQLIRASDDRHLWAEKYERDFTDVLGLQADVANAVVAQIESKLAAGRSATPARSVNGEAYTTFLQASFFFHQGTRGTAKSIGLFERAIALDPSHADSHAGLAEALIYAAIFGLRPSAEAYPIARAAAQKALELDPNNAAARNALADVKKGFDWDLRGAEADYLRALELSPSRLITRLWYAECLSRMNRFDEAIAETGRAVALDPVSAFGHTNRTMILWRARRHEEAIRAGQQTLELDPSRSNALWWLGLAHAGVRDFAKSVACLDKARGIIDNPMSRGYLGHVHGLSGERAKAEATLKELSSIHGQYVSPVDFAVVHAGLNNADAAFEWLEKARQIRSARVHELNTPVYDSLKSDPRYGAFGKSVGLDL